MEAVYPAVALGLTRGRRWRRGESRVRHHTMPVTLAEIKEVDEEKDSDEKVTSASSASNVCLEERRPDVSDDTLDRRFVEFRNRRNRKHRDVIREPDEDKHNEACSESTNNT